MLSSAVRVGLTSFARSAGGFNFASLWPTGTEPGLWLDPPTTTSGYQESTGNTLLYEPGQGSIDPPVGLRLDKHTGFAPTTVAPPTTAFNSTVTNGGVYPSTATSTVNGSYGFQRTSALVIGQLYTYTVSWSGNTSGRVIQMGDGAGNASQISSSAVSGTITGTRLAGTTTLYIYAGSALIGETFTVDSASVQKLGNGSHVSQATAAARPTLSRRVNLLAKTEQLSSAPWAVSNVSVAANGSAWRITDATAAASGALQQSITAVASGLVVTYLLEFERQASGSFAVGFGSFWCFVDHATLATVNDVVFSGTSPTSLAAVVSGTRCRLTCTVTTTAAASVFSIYPAVAAGTQTDINSVSNQTVTGFLDVYNAHLQLGASGRYQSVDTASTYDTSGFLQFDKFDGADDGYGTATLAAGVIGNANMDCFMLVKRNSAARGILGYRAAGADAFGIFDSADAVATWQGGAGASSTPYVNGVAVAGGNAATRAALATAIPVGEWVVFEARNLDIALWVGFGLGLYGSSFNLNGQEAQVILCPAKTDTERGQIRRKLAAMAGITVV